MFYQTIEIGRKLHLKKRLREKDEEEEEPILWKCKACGKEFENEDKAKLYIDDEIEKERENTFLWFLWRKKKEEEIRRKHAAVLWHHRYG